MFKILRKVLPVLLLGLLFIFPIVNTPAYADGGAHGSTGHGGGGFGGDGTHNTANKARAMYWQIFTAENTDYVEDWDWENMVKDHPDVICTFLTDGRPTGNGVDRFYGWDSFLQTGKLGQKLLLFLKTCIITKNQKQHSLKKRTIKDIQTTYGLMTQQGMVSNVDFIGGVGFLI